MDLGQSLWVDNISREMLVTGLLARYIADCSVTGLTSNPTIFEHAIGHGSFYDQAIARLARRGEPAEELFFARAVTCRSRRTAAATAMGEHRHQGPGSARHHSHHSLQAFADHGKVGAALPADGGDAEAVLDAFRREGVDEIALATRLQREGAEAFAVSWHALLTRIQEKSKRLMEARARAYLRTVGSIKRTCSAVCVEYAAGLAGQHCHHPPTRPMREPIRHPLRP